jgi:hypothetical protein
MHYNSIAGASIGFYTQGRARAANGINRIRTDPPTCLRSRSTLTGFISPSYPRAIIVCRQITNADFNVFQKNLLGCVASYSTAEKLELLTVFKFAVIANRGVVDEDPLWPVRRVSFQLQRVIVEPLNY